MSSVFQIQNPHNGIVVIELREPIITECELIEMAYPFKRFLVEDARKESHPEPVKSPQNEFIKGITKVEGLRRVQIWPYRITLHLATLYAVSEVLEPVKVLIAECWPEARFDGYNHLGTHALGTTVAELEAVPNYEDLCASMRDSGLKLSFKAHLPGKPDKPIWVHDFRPTSARCHIDGTFIFHAGHNCFITEHSSRKVYFMRSTDRYIFDGRLLVDFNKNQARLDIPSSNK